jgi:hypothetical protein
LRKVGGKSARGTNSRERGSEESFENGRRRAAERRRRKKNV